MLRYFTQARDRLAEIKTRYRDDGSVLITKEERLFNHRFTSVAPDESRLGRWKNEMTLKERTEFARIAGDLLDSLGYGAEG
jgi:hypothetical protein